MWSRPALARSRTCDKDEHARPNLRLANSARKIHAVECALVSGVATMNNEQKQTAIGLMKAVGILQLKVLLGAARDLALGPTAIAAAFVDLVLLKQQTPRFFHHVLRFGEKSDRWIDVWSGGRHPEDDPRENVDALIARVEDVVRDPERGARQARVLRRWADRQVKRAKRRAAAEVASRSPLLPPSPPPQPPR
jgi:hypothetical protein